MSLDEVAQRTRVPLRHLKAIEEASYGNLPSITYAMGFAKAYARIVGLDEAELGSELRKELGSTFEARPEYVPFEMADPTRVPSRGLAWAGAAVAGLIILVAAIWFGSSFFSGSPSATQQSATAEAPAQVGARPAIVPPPAAAPIAGQASGEQVTLVAKDEVWIRVYDAKNETLLLKTLAAGERYDVPRDADRPIDQHWPPGCGQRHHQRLGSRARSAHPNARSRMSRSAPRRSAPALPVRRRRSRAGRANNSVQCGDSRRLPFIGQA